MKAVLVSSLQERSQEIKRLYYIWTAFGTALLCATWSEGILTIATNLHIFDVVLRSIYGVVIFIGAVVVLTRGSKLWNSILQSEKESAAVGEKLVERMSWSVFPVQSVFSPFPGFLFVVQSVFICVGVGFIAFSRSLLLVFLLFP